MAISKQASGSYKVNLPYPKEFRKITGIQQTRYQKTWKSLELAQKDEKDVKASITKVIEEKNSRSLQQTGNIKFSKFYEDVWIERYEMGMTGRTDKIPSAATLENTKLYFREHLIPIFGEYSLNYLNNEKELVSRLMMKKAKEYANIKTLKCYFLQIFDTAEQLDYIEYNRLGKLLKNLSSPKKRELKMKRELAGESLTAEELIEWIEAAQNDLSDGKISLQDYVLFMITMHLGDRKSESYALQWRHIDFDNRRIYLVQSQDRYGEIKSTKGNKNTVFKIPDLIYDLLVLWKEQQREELHVIGLKQTESQRLFTYTNRRGEVNQPVHIDYLNRRINAIQQRHTELATLNPHKLRHTFGTLASLGGASMDSISKALTHSELKTTRIYVNAPDFVDSSVHDSFALTLERAKVMK